LDLTPCDIIIIFTSSLTQELGMIDKLTSGEPFIEISTQFDLSDEEFVSTVTHELGHAFGLGHYITDEPELIEKWDQGMDIPSIMIEYAVSNGIEEITELDLEKMVSIYGTDGFSKFHPGVDLLPTWIQIIYQWNEEGLLADLELDNAIDYLVENGII
jgi:hypothetical protein